MLKSNFLIPLIVSLKENVLLQVDENVELEISSDYVGFIINNIGRCEVEDHGDKENGIS